VFSPPAFNNKVVRNPGNRNAAIGWNENNKLRKYGYSGLFYILATRIPTGKHIEPMAINRHLSKQVFILLWLTSQCMNAYTQSAVFNSRKDSLQYDFNWLQKDLQHDYASLYRYNSKEAITALFDSCYASIQNTTSDLDFFTMVKFLQSQIRDGHLSCSPSRDLRQYLSNLRAYFPGRLRFINNKVYTYSVRNNRLSPGKEIMAINKMPIAEIKNKLFQYIVGDGYIDTRKNYILGNYFYIYYFLAFGGHPNFDISYKTAKGSIRTKRLEAVREQELPPIADDRKKGKLLDLSITPDQIAVLTIQSFDESTIGEAGLDFDYFLRTAFTRIREQNIRKLVIDLRHNGGGTDLYGSLLYSYLSSDTFHYYKSLEAATDQLSFVDYKRAFTSFNDLTPDLLTKTTAGTYQLKPAAHNNLQPISPAANNYTHAVWFLVDGLSFSTTAEFCAIARSHNRGKFIGEETGGAYEGNTSGVPMKIILFSSQLTVSFGSIQYNMDVLPSTHPGRGIIPDYPVLPTIKDLLNKKDSQLERALEIVRKGK
jgi:hypothetical protein